MLRYLYSAVLFVLLICSLASAQIPDIRGTWKRTEGELSCGGKSADLVSIRIRQREDRIQISCRFASETYTAPAIYVRVMDNAEQSDSSASGNDTAHWSDSSLLVDHHELIFGKDLGTRTERWTLAPDGKQLTVTQYGRVSVFKKNASLGTFGVVLAVAVPSFIWLFLLIKFRHNEEALDRLKGAIAVSSLAAVLVSYGLNVSDDYKGLAPGFLIAGIGLLFVTKWIKARIPAEPPALGEWWPGKNEI